jgi:hypothetical protein
VYWVVEQVAAFYRGRPDQRRYGQTSASGASSDPRKVW